MRGMILAAGRGERMGALTANTPKPLLKAAGLYLIEYSIFSLLKIGIEEIVINISYHGEQIKAALGDGERYGATFHYSEEPEALETGGGIFQALPLLGSEPFVVLSSDVATDYPLQKLPKEPDGLAHLILVDNPFFHPKGDFCLREKRLYRQTQNQFTFANVGVYRPELFIGCKPSKFRLGDVLIKAVERSDVTGEHYQGVWFNLGTPEELEKLKARHP
ncbi:MAG: N-acetylmuramate alpha-1-phosphate uridylyltransferase MurU [Gammaproteobacteria bacterium]